VPSPDDLRARARELLELADRMEADEARARALTGGAGAPTMATMDTATDTRVRPGVPLRSTGPYAIAARNSGHSLYELAQIFGLKYSTLKRRDHLKYAPPEDQKSLARKPYSVPATAWRK
jgi:hypothetical protein